MKSFSKKEMYALDFSALIFYCPFVILVDGKTIKTQCSMQKRKHINKFFQDLIFHNIFQLRNENSKDEI